MVNNISVHKNIGISPSFEKKKVNRVQITNETPQEKLDRIYRSQGLIGKFFDKIQGALGVGLSRKKLQQQISKSPNGNIEKQLDKYYDQQKNSSELTLDLATGVFAAGAFRLAKKINTYSHLYTKNLKFEKGSMLVGLGISAIAGLITKPILKRINNIGTPKKERKQEQTLGKDMLTGLIDGATAPIVYAYKFGLLATVGINSVSRYAFNKKADKESNFTDHLSNSWVAKITSLGLAGLSAFKFHKRIDVLEKAIVKSKENVKNIEVFKTKMPLSELLDLAKTNIKDKKTQTELIDSARKGFFSKAYYFLTKPINKRLHKTEGAKVVDAVEFGTKPIIRTLFMRKHLIKEKEMMNVMKEVEQYNIFYPKMIQTLPSNVSSMIEAFGGDANKLDDFLGSKKAGKYSSWMDNFINKRKKYISENGVNSLSEFLNKYKSCCPSSRTVKEAQKHISETYGNRFTLKGKKPLGVGTIAESYLAKDNETGNDVVIKVVKKWVTEDKLKADKEKMVQVIERAKDKMKPDEYNYQLKLVDELYSAWTKELNLGLEAEAAETLGKFAQNYNTVAPISVKNNIFVMEKANGVQFDKFAEYLEKNNIKLTADEAADLLRTYLQVFFEQLLSVPKKGCKVMHADPHAGNIFIDIKNKEKPFTFIDTGNVMRFTPEEAIQNVTSHLDYLIGNSKAISKKLLKGAVLPSDVTEKQAEEMLAKHLDEVFFSGKYKIRTSDPFTAINNESIDFMKKNKIILNSSNTNMIKAELTYIMNLFSISKIAKNVNWDTKIDENQQLENMKLMGKQILDSIISGAANNKRCTYKEVSSRIKFMRDNPEQVFTTLYTYIKPDAFNKKVN
ncbi:MAG: hypothetical protein E7Z89_08195 [Cyanobacteria bacterium SIG28]|nr:hypothetical protein [Cyanobacteria bacterium SIG28]